MSLNWNIEKIRDYEELKIDSGDGETWELDGLTNGIIWSSMVTGLGKDWSLDEDFAPELYARLKILERLNGPIVTRAGEPYSITPEDVERRIGLSVNVAPVSRAKFLNTVKHDLDRELGHYKHVMMTAKAEAEKVTA